MRGAATALILVLASWPTTPPADIDSFRSTLTVEQPGEAIATIFAGCERCSGGKTGHEAGPLRVSVDGRYSQHLLLSRGEASADYQLTLGDLPSGRHTITIEGDAALSAASVGPAIINGLGLKVVPRDLIDDWLAQSMAPILYARPNTVGRFTDLPILMWYEIVPTFRGRQFRYSVVFTNEDGGTASDRLMATWGRTTDIEFVYGAEVDATGV